MTILLDVMFRASITNAIPKIIDLLSHRELNVRTVGTDALSKLFKSWSYIKFSDVNIVNVLFVAEFLRSWKAQ